MCYVIFMSYQASLAIVYSCLETNLSLIFLLYHTSKLVTAAGPSLDYSYEHNYWRYFECLYNVKKLSVNTQKVHFKTIRILKKLNYFMNECINNLLSLCMEIGLFILPRVLYDKNRYILNGFIRQNAYSRDHKKHLKADITFLSQ